MRQIKAPSKLQFLGVVFVIAVGVVVYHTHQLIIPIFLGMFAWGKVWLKVWIKSLTPKLGLLLLKNSAVIQLRSIAARISAHFFVKSHKPWRRFLTRIRVAIVSAGKNLFSGYLGLPLWLRTTIAIAVLVATAGSSFAIFALLIIPQPLLDWLRKRIGMALNKLGVTRLFTTLWRRLAPEQFRHRWYMYIKWTLGRQQIRAAKRVHEKVAKSPPAKQGDDASAATAPQESI